MVKTTQVIFPADAKTTANFLTLDAPAVPFKSGGEAVYALSCKFSLWQSILFYANSQYLVFSCCSKYESFMFWFTMTHLQMISNKKNFILNTVGCIPLLIPKVKYIFM